MLTNVSQFPTILARRIVGLAVIAILGACASAPATRKVSIANEQPLTVQVNKSHYKQSQYVNARALQEHPSIVLPMPTIAKAAHTTAVTSAQAAMVANHAARSSCVRLAKYAELLDAPAPGVLEMRLEITAIKPTSGALSGVSAVLGYFSPVPLRLPAGLGGLAVEAELRDPERGQIALVHWARGTNSITQDAKLSAIGDAWQLAGQFGTDFARAVLDHDPKRFGIQRERVSKEQLRRNRALCNKHYGKLNVMGRVAGMVLPLGPGAADSGQPETEGQ